MQPKVSGIIFWILSIFFLLSAIINDSFFSRFISLAAALFVNPQITDFIFKKFKFKTKTWMKVVSIILCFILIVSFSPSSDQSNPDQINEQTPTQNSQDLNNNTENTTIETQKPETTGNTDNIKIIGDLKAHYIDVGQGDSAFIELPNGEAMLIDAGEAENGTKIANYIENMGYSTINYLVATHPHADHIGGMETVIDNLSIKSIYMPKAVNNTRTYEDLLLAIKNKGLTITTAKAGVNIIDSDKLSISIIAPNSNSYSELNDYSAVIMLQYGNTSFLFMGDAETASENEIIADVDADVLKVGHHGSSTSTGESFLEKVSPKYAVISVGENNSYGHPTSETLEKLENAGVIVYRTDLDGTINFVSDGTNITVDKTPKKESTTPSSSGTTNSTVDNSSNDDTTVYVTKTGEKYHRDGCQYLRQSKIEISLSSAKSQGYTPCSRCNPPQ